MVKIQYCSDLHLEFKDNYNWLKKNPIKPAGEILILAGDTIYLEEEFFKYDFFDWASDNFKEVFMIPGNHEYYGGFDIKKSYPSLDIPIRSNVRILNNVCIKNKDVNLIFSTLWSDLKKNVEFIYMTMADFHFGKYNGKPFITEHYLEIHKESLTFISDTLNKSDGKNVVITHHLPSRLCYNSDLKDAFLTDAYCTDLHSFIESHKIDYWIYGHCHWNTDPIKINRTVLLTNQLGYLNKGEHLHFDREKFIKI